jgi:thiamine-phosphate pyrophosphorylase
MALLRYGVAGLCFVRERGLKLVEKAGRPFPRLYPILDAELVLQGVAEDGSQRHARLQAVMAELIASGVQIVQYRNKRDEDAVVIEDARVIREAARRMGAAPVREGEIRLVLNDRAGLVAEAGWDGVHVGQQDLPAGEARRIVGERAWVGLSTHNEVQLRAADEEPVDYIAIGPVFATGSKMNPDPVIGLEGVRRARALTGKALVAIGGITTATAGAVIEAGADSVAVIAAIFGPGRRVEQSARDFLANLK